jgi:hypothetical protein
VIGWGIKRFAVVRCGRGIVAGVGKEAGEDAKEKNAQPVDEVLDAQERPWSIERKQALVIPARAVARQAQLS